MSCTSIWSDICGVITDIKCTVLKTDWSEDHSTTFTVNGDPYHFDFDIYGACTETPEVHSLIEEDGQTRRDPDSVNGVFDIIRLKISGDEDELCTCEVTFVGDNKIFTILYSNEHNGYYPHYVNLYRGQDTTWENRIFTTPL